MATREFSDTLRCLGRCDRVGGGGRMRRGGGGGREVDKGQRSNKPDTITEA